MSVCLSVFSYKQGRARGAGGRAGARQGKAWQQGQGRANTRPLLSIIDRARQGRTGPVGYI